MAKIDLDAARAARHSDDAQAPTASFGGRDFTLPAELPFGVFVHLAAMKREPDSAVEAVEAMLGILFGDDEAAAFIDLDPSMDDITALVDGLMKEYGLDTGEALASPTS